MPEVRLIDANAFLEQYGNYYAEEGPAEGFIGTVGELIAKQPTIEPRVRHGQWRIIDNDWNCWRCTCCGEERVLNDGNPSDNGMMFCPHCGARMDGEEAKENATD